VIADTLDPVMPATSKKILELLNVDERWRARPLARAFKPSSREATTPLFRASTRKRASKRRQVCYAPIDEKVIDSHCHLADAKFRDDVEGAIERPTSPASRRSLQSARLDRSTVIAWTVEIAERHKNVFAAVGVHPHDAKDCTPDRIARSGI